MGCTRDARIIVTDGLFTTPLQLWLGKSEEPGDKLRQILFDDPLILRGGRDDFRIENSPSIANAVTMVQNASRGFRTGTTSGGLHWSGNCCSLWRFVLGDDAQRFVASI